MSKNSLSGKQLSAILSSVQTGLRIQQDFPEIAGRYRNGNSLTEIARDFNFPEKYGVNFLVSREAVRKALSGYDGRLRDFPEKYLGLISKDELIELEIAHKEDGSRKARELKLGIMGSTVEQRRGYSRLAIIAQGKVPWVERKEISTLCTLSEIEFAYMLSQSLEFRIGEGHNSGKTDLCKLTDTLNEIYHKGENIRVAGAVCSKLVKFRKSKNGKERLL